MVRRKLSPYWRRFLLGWVLLCCSYTESQAQNHSGQSIVKIGALFSFNSKAGKSIRMALELALDEVNEDPTLLNGTKLALVIADSNCSALQGASAAIDLVNKGVVAIIGPQTSVESHFVAHIAEATQVPLVSFSVTDPALSQLQYPYFTRVIPSDARQMAAIAGIVDYYGWKEVVALCTDDDFGKNAIQALRNALAQFGSRIVYTAAINPNIGGNEFSSLLIELKQMNTRVFVVHMKPNLGQTLLSVATHLRMLSTGYVWLVTDSISNMLGTRPHGVNSLEIPQGIVGSRNYVPMSTKLKYIQSELKNRVWGTYLGNQFISTDALYAYDALWMVAKAVDSIMGHQKHGSFASPASVTAMSDGNSDLAKAKVFNDGPMLLHKILGTRISGVTGSIGLDAKGDCLNSTFEIVNRVGSGLKVVGYWTPETGCLTIPPPPDNAKGAFNATKGEKALGHVIWPGGSTKIPNGQVDPRGGKPLRILVPNKSGLRKFVGTIVDAHNKTRAYGFCVEVFEAAVSQLPYNVSYTYTAFGTGSSTPIYEDLIEKVAKKEFDAAVGDIAITTKRSKTVDFTQPFAVAGLMVVVPKRDNRSTRTWEFLKPFALSMYFTMAAFVVFTAIVMWILEHRINKAFQKSPKKATLWFMLSTLFFIQSEEVKTVLGKIVLIVWLFVVLIITSSYTANLTSILTVERLRPTMEGIAGLITTTVHIGYQRGSFTRDYLLELGIAKERLIPLDSLSNYTTALSLGPQRGGVEAIVDELPDIQLLLSKTCKFEVSGQEIRKGGWGFAFQKGSQLAIDMSTAILYLAESGELQHIHDKWLGNSACRSSEENSNRLGTPAFVGPFLISGLVSTVSILFYCVRLGNQFRNEKGPAKPERVGCAQIAESLKSFVKFVFQNENALESSSSSCSHGEDISFGDESEIKDESAKHGTVRHERLPSNIMP